MSRLIIHLSGNIPNNFIVQPDDYLYHSSSMANLNVLKNSKRLFAHDETLERDLCKKFTDFFCGNDKLELSKQDIGICFINDYYSYSVRPVFFEMLAIKKLCEKYNYLKIIIISAKTNCQLIPMFGFSTNESKRGSDHLLGSIVAQQFKSNNFNENIEFLTFNGDIYCNEFFRKTILKLANIFFLIFFVMKLFLLISKESLDSEKKPLIIYRNKHQLRFAAKISATDSEFTSLYIPQLTHGFLLSKDRLENIRGKICNIGFTFKDIMVSIKNFINISHKNKEKLNEKSVDSFIELDGLFLYLNNSWVARELCLVSIFFMYSTLLDRILKKNNIQKLISFELVGRMAGLEARCAKKLDVKTYTLQTAVVASRPHPIFPFSDKFFTDSNQTKSLLKDIGQVNFGSVEFSGVLELFSDLKDVNSFKKIVFYTQPYELEVTKKIISEIYSWSKINKSKFLIKLHPRDKLSDYADLNLNSLIINQDISIKDLFSWADLTITRTSSVAKESLLVGCPIMLTMWTEVERKISADYINKELSEFYISQDVKSMVALLDNPTKLINSNASLRTLIYESLGPENLAKALSNE